MKGKDNDRIWNWHSCVEIETIKNTFVFELKQFVFWC